MPATVYGDRDEISVAVDASVALPDVMGAGCHAAASGGVAPGDPVAVRGYVKAVLRTGAGS